MKRNSWKILVVLALMLAVIVVMNGKRITMEGQQTAALAASTKSASASPSCACIPSGKPAGGTCSCATTGSSTASAPSAAQLQVKAAVKAMVPRLVDLGSKTCIPCKMMAPILEELSKENPKTLKVVFYDIYEKQDKSREYGVRVIPTQVFFDKNGKEFFRHEGFMPKTDIIAKFKEKGIMLKGDK